MTRFMVCWFVSVLFTTAAAAQTPTDAVPARANSLVPGAWAVQFQVENDFTLEPFNGTMISLKRQFSSHSALRIGVGLDLANYDDDEHMSTAIADTVTDSQLLEGDTQNQAVRLDLLYVRYPNPGAAVNWYWGAGPTMRYQHDESTTDGLYDDDRTMTRHTQVESWGLGALGCMGVEWFASKNVSLHAEYYATVQYTSSNSELLAHTTGNEDTPSRDTASHRERESLAFDGANVLLGLSLYF